ncbi:unnamed protein product [Trifolium pratense]|uniref:Uncharacterized protein n=1 Tax=Trifolium pratense TaxID=57577 RepID=A0ACB0LFH6_TRIPR|nr:unnamed protein product [Trifolium pratense]
MKIVSLNMRGWGGRAKRGRLSQFLKKGMFDLCMLQETKRAHFDDSMIHNLWGHQDVHWAAKEAVGPSGGILTIWNSNLFKLLNIFYGDGFVGLCVDWEGMRVNIVNVYSPCNLAGKRKLWEDLLNLRRGESGEWCIGGVFNAILHLSERKGSSVATRRSEVNFFREFVDDMELIDIPVLGKKFSWFSPDGIAMSRLDRFLLSEGFLKKNDVKGQWIGDRDISDHCPVWLLSSSCNWGPKPFRVINGWLEHPEFKGFVESTWKSYDIRGKKAFVLKEKLKLLRESLKKWNKEVFGYLDLNIEKTVSDINEFEGLLSSTNGDVDYLMLEGLNKEFWMQLHFKDSLLKQKSRSKWVKEGDSNTKFFHQTLKGRRRNNQLVALRDGDKWVQGVDEIKYFVKNYFANNFTEEWRNRPTLDGLSFNSLSEEDNSSLLSPFSVEEVREVVWNSDGNKCPGPNGFNFNFLKTCWDILKTDVMEFLNEFHSSASLPKAITASFLTLVPKKDNPQVLSDYRPICLVGCLYKILSKVLAARLKKVIGKLISDCQTAFVPNRQILDGVLVVNELIDFAKRRKDNCLLLKVDFERAYDTVNWNFLEYMMRRMGFAQRWLKWMRACIFTSSMSVLVNGSPTVDFVVGKGLRQGDPLYPFLFLIVAEGLTRLMQKAVDNGNYHGFKVHDDLQFHTLQFADDTVLVGEGKWENLWSLKIVLRSFELVSGLKVNFYKSKLYGINLDDNFVSAASSFLHCEVESIPFRFLGIPVGANPRRKVTWNPIVEAMKKRLNTWSGRNLSFGGRVTLINSVLSSLPLYFFSFFKVPVCVLQELITIQRRFLWGGCSDIKKICWVSWDTICLPKDKGGLGIKNLNYFNQALLCKWKWRGLCDHNTLWTKLLEHRYGSLADNFLHSNLSNVKGQSLWWRDIMKIGGIENDAWFRTNVSNDADNRRWELTQSGIFSVNSTYEFLHSREVVVAIDENIVKALQQLWLNDVPSKVSIFGWRLLLSRLPTRMVLARKSILVNPHELCCIFCFEEQEELSHVLFNCSFSQKSWKRIFKWMNVDFISFDDGWNHFSSFGALLKNKKYEKARHVIWLATTWCIWRARNNVVFRGEAINWKALEDKIIYISWFWFIGKIASKSSCVFSDWCKDPLNCIISM